MKSDFSLAAVVFLGALFLSSILILKIYRYNNLSAPAGFGCASAEICYARANEWSLPKGALVFKTGGYDGQFYYYLAASIFSDRKAVLDSDSFRRSRIGYPLLGSLFYSPGPESLLIALFVLPVFFHALAIFALGRLSSSLWPALAYAINPLSLLGSSLMLADGLACSMFLCAVWLADAKHKRSFFYTLLSFLFAAFAVLTKETMAVPVFALGTGSLVSFLRKEGSYSKAIFWGFSLLPAFFWFWMTGFFSASAAKAGIPFSGVVEYLRNPDAFFSGRNFLVLFLLMVAFFTARSFYLFFARKEKGTVFFLFAFALLFTGFAGSEYWSNFANISRLFFPVLPALALQKERGFPEKLPFYFFLLFSWIVFRADMFSRLLESGIWPFK